MFGDLLYCEVCKTVYRDIDPIHDTRKEPMFKPMCPVCGAWSSINIHSRMKSLNDLSKFHRQTGGNGISDHEMIIMKHEKDCIKKALMEFNFKLLDIPKKLKELKHGNRI